MACTDHKSSLTDYPQRLPAWFKQDIPDAHKMGGMKHQFRRAGLHTVCESALCPNMGRCWGRGVATFMILGDVCTRACRFCGVNTGAPDAVNPDEPLQAASAVKDLRLRYAVITSVTRDDLKDGGARQFARTVRAVRDINPGTKVEVLIPDFKGELDSLEKVVAVRPDVIGHNIETVRRLSARVRPQADYDRSLAVLRNVKRLGFPAFVKSGLMVGLGETDDEVRQAMRDLVEAGCDMLTIGQYLAPSGTGRHIRVQRFVSPERFGLYAQQGRAMGLKHVMSDPLVRSSYIAEQGYEECLKRTMSYPGEDLRKADVH